MPLYATYDRDGTIVSITQIDEPPIGVPRIVAVPTDDHEVVEVELDEETFNMDHGELIQDFIIDPGSKKLVRRHRPAAGHSRGADD
jgi:hypothetical protein